MRSAAFQQYKRLIDLYNRVLPAWSFPWIPLTVAAAFQVVAWFGGTFFQSFTLGPRILVLWLFALGEYSFMSPAMNAAIEVLGMREPLLVVIYQVVTLVVFILMYIFVFKKPFHLKYLISFGLLTAAVYVAYML